MFKIFKSLGNFLNSPRYDFGVLQVALPCSFIYLFCLADSLVDLDIKPEPEAVYPKYPNSYPFSPKPVTRIAPVGNETEYPN
jgi:hypothetical protein